jgi:methionyl-tRNA formyltransferase
MNKLTVGLLSTLDNPLLPFFIKEISKFESIRMIVFCDQKLISAKDMEIWFNRTNCYFENQKLSIYDFQDKILRFYMINHIGDSIIDVIKSEKVDCLLNAGTPRKLPIDIISSTKYGVLNIHPGSLPAYKGCSAVEWAIYNNDIVANTAHFMDVDYDTGPIVRIEPYNFTLQDTYVTIRCKVFEASCTLAASVLNQISLNTSSSLDLKHQSPSDGNYYSPIPEKEFQEVISMITNKRYRYMS